MPARKKGSSCGFHHIALRTHEFDQAVKFYCDVLGFKQKMEWGEGTGRAVMLDGGNGNFVEIFASATPENRTEGAILHYAIRTDDCDAMLARARGAGAKVTMEATTCDVPSRPEKARVRIAFCIGPAGETIEFFQELAC
jgi:glyoxylase I family protein